jgi:HEAT repeat protein
MLLSLSADSDPGVRNRAVAGLGQRSDAAADTDEALVARLGSDPWPRIRRAAAGALARRCNAEAGPRSALDRAVDKDRDIEVRRAALTALVQCRAPGIGERLLAVARRDQNPLKLRQRALSLVPVLGDPRLAMPLIDLFAALRKRAWSDKDAVTLAAAAAVALGRLGATEAVAPLLAAARDESFAEVQAAAITGLGEMCAPAALPLFAAAAGSAQRAVAIAARGAHNRCRR